MSFCAQSLFLKHKVHFTVFYHGEHLQSRGPQVEVNVL